MTQLQGSVHFRNKQVRLRHEEQRLAAEAMQLDRSKRLQSELSQRQSRAEEEAERKSSGKAVAQPLSAAHSARVSAGNQAPMSGDTKERPQRSRDGGWKSVVEGAAERRRVEEETRYARERSKREQEALRIEEARQRRQEEQKAKAVLRLVKHVTAIQSQAHLCLSIGRHVVALA